MSREATPDHVGTVLRLVGSDATLVQSQNGPEFVRQLAPVMGVYGMPLDLLALAVGLP